MQGRGSTVGNVDSGVRKARGRDSGGRSASEEEEEGEEEEGVEEEGAPEEGAPRAKAWRRRRCEEKGDRQGEEGGREGHLGDGGSVSVEGRRRESVRSSIFLLMELPRSAIMELLPS